MRLSLGRLAPIRELWPIFLVAIGVALLSTLAGSVFDHVHQVDAEEFTAAETTATPSVRGTQVLAFADWGVQLTTPLAPELPTLKYTTRPGNTVGISSADLAALSATCHASQNALGVLMRAPLGTFTSSKHGGSIQYFIGTIGPYEYTYTLPQTSCSDTEAGHTIVNRETSAIIASLDSLAAVSR